MTPTDADLESYYQAHTADFQQAEQAAVEYVVLDIDSVRAGITLNEDDLRTYYKENVARLAGKEERRASHILINALKDAPAADREKPRPVQPSCSSRYARPPPLLRKLPNPPKTPGLLRRAAT